MSFLTEQSPEETGTFAFVMMKQGLGIVEALFAGDRTHAEAADIFDAGRADQVCDDVDGFVEVFTILRFDAGNGAKTLADIRDLVRQAGEHLLGAEIEIKAPAGIQM